VILAQQKGINMKRQFRDYQEQLIQDLQDPELASLYLSEALKDENPCMFLLALKNVCAAQGEAMTALAKEAKVSRENLYRILSKKGNPKLNNIISLLNAVGFQLSVLPYKK
jgi:probable addiction module antidote protein